MQWTLDYSTVPNSLNIINSYLYMYTRNSHT